MKKRKYNLKGLHYAFMALKVDSPLTLTATAGTAASMLRLAWKRMGKKPATVGCVFKYSSYKKKRIYGWIFPIILNDS